MLARDTEPHRAAECPPVLRDDDDRLDWLRERLWHLVIGTVIGVTPVLSVRYGPLLSLLIVLIMYLPLPSAGAYSWLRWPFHASPAQRS